MTEGRKAFLDRVAGIEAGSECERLAPLLSRLVDGEATADDLTTLRPHIRTCLSCRAALREYRRAPATAAALVPAAVLALPSRPGFLDLPARVSEALAGWTHKAHNAAEMASAQKVAAVAASTAAIGGGAVVTVQQVDRRPEPPRKRVAHVERERAAPRAPASATPPPTSTTPSIAAPASPQLSAAERRARAAKRKTPPAQQEFEPAWAAGEPTASTSTATASTSTSEPIAPAPQPTPSGGGAEEFAP